MRRGKNGWSTHAPAGGSDLVLYAQPWPPGSPDLCLNVPSPTQLSPVGRDDCRKGERLPRQGMGEETHTPGL